MTDPIDARQLAALRKRRFAETGRALKSLLDEAGAHQGALGTGDVPPADGLRKLADRYLRLLGSLDIIDAVLTPEALEAVAAEDDGKVAVRRDDLALLTEVVRGMVPGGAEEDTPLGRLSFAAGTGPREMAELAAMAMVPDGERDAGWPPMPAEGM